MRLPPPVGNVPRAWPGSTVVCLGGGPSLTREDVEYCRGKARVIAINDAYRLAPWADVLYAADRSWWRYHRDGVKSFAGLKYSVRMFGHDEGGSWPEGVQVLENAGGEGLSLKPTALKCGRDSGYQAINLAVLFGASRILLLGYDMKRSAGKAHWFGEHPEGLARHSPYENFREKYLTLRKPLAAAGVTVLNCSPDTALIAFPRQPLREALGAAEAAA